MNSRLQTYAGYIAKSIVLLCIAVLIGWKFNSTVLKSILPGLVAMNPFTALGFIATALWQLLSIRYGHTGNKAVNALASLLAFFVLTIGVFKIFDLVTTTDYSFDDALFTSNVGDSRMSQLSAFNFTLFGAAMLVCGIRRRRCNILVALLTPVFTVAMVSLFGYTIGNYDINTLKPFKPIALHATLCFLALTLSFLLLFPENILVRRYRSKDLGGYMIRLLLPYIFGVPFSLGFLCYQGVRLQLYDTGFGISLFFISYILMALLIVIWQSTAISNVDEHRRTAETEAAQRSAELELANTELEKRNEELEQFAFAASHDMQEPLRKIYSFSSYLLQQKAEGLDAQSRQYLEKIGQSAHRMKRIIEDLLQYSHHTRADIFATPTNLDEVVADIENDLELAIREKGASIQKQPLPIIPAAPLQMHQLFINLVANGLKFSRPGVAPQISISCRPLPPHMLQQHPGLDPKRSYVEISVSDNGIGFRPEYAQQIFGLFKRLHSKTDYEGTGIGLALCKKVVDNHKGLIWAESNPGHGATFFVVLPTT